MAHRGLGVGRVSGLVVFLFGALAGEEVTARVTKVQRRHAFADTIKVHRSSRYRVDPPCPYFGSCGGCQLQHADYPYQVEVKREVLQRALDRAGIERPADVEALAAAHPWRYRWRGEFHRSESGSPLGFKSRKSYQVLGVADCLIHHSTITGCLAAIGAAVASQSASVQTVQLTVGDQGRELLVDARPDGSASAAIVVGASPEVADGVTLTDEATRFTYEERDFRVFSDSFIQVNEATVALLYEGVCALLAPEVEGAHVIDAYGGLGVLSLRLADLGARVTVIEANPVSARLCQLHAEMYAPNRVTTICGSVESELPRADPATALVLDPPRAGLGPEVRDWLVRAGPATVVYLSCEVSALTRDLQVLCQIGPYRVEVVRLVDMFPQTYHFETLVLLRRR
ncbi:MAG: class I SAM-dependent RNA methyltransferase [Candidatus Dormibacteria bacterium]